MNTTTAPPRVLSVEAVADLPVLWAKLQRLDFISLVNKYLPPVPHWKGPLSPGEVLALWLLYILSQGDHRLYSVEPWVARYPGILHALLGKPVAPNAVHDDRLADLLDRLSDRDLFHQFEADLNRQTIRVYQLPSALVRIDTTTANSYAQASTEGGLLQFGHSKDNPELPQLKVALAVLDPLGMPLTTDAVAGNSADDPLYIPTIARVREALGAGGRTYVGDCKMAALATRAFVAAGKDVYLCPLSEKQLDRAARQKLLESVWTGQRALEAVYRPGKAEGDAPELVAEGFAVEVELQAEVEGKEASWLERRWLVRSATYQASQREGLERRLCKAQEELRELPERKQGKKQRDETELRAAVETIMKRERVTGLLRCQVTAVTTTQMKRKYKQREALPETKVSYGVTVERCEDAIKEAVREMGWQVYGTNGLGLGLAEVIAAYRGQYRIENNWSRLKGKPLGLTPLYLQDEDRIRGLVHLLSLGLRVLSLLEWEARKKLSEKKVKMKGIYPGQAGRQTARPSSEMLLQVFEIVTISVVAVGTEVYVLLSPLTDGQRQLLDLWGLPADLYESLLPSFPKPPLKTSEP